MVVRTQAGPTTAWLGREAASTASDEASEAVGSCLPANACALYRRADRQVPTVARRMVAAYVAEIPMYRRLPASQLDGEITDLSVATMRLFLRALASGRLPDDDELADVRASAVRRAEERVPLEDILAAYHIGTRVGFDALAEDATPEEGPALVAAASFVPRWMVRVTAAVTGAYLEEQASILGEERDARRVLAHMLLSGQPAGLAAERAGVPLAPAYVVACLDLGGSAEESDTAVSPLVAGRRKVRRVQSELDRAADAPVPSLLDATGGLVLLPVAAGSTACALNGLDLLQARLRRAADSDVALGAASAERAADVPAAAGQARELLRLGKALGRQGAHRMSDLLLEYQLTRATAALPCLAGLLDPLGRSPDLLRTLEAYLDHDLDRRSTAAALHVHPNTLDYRLRKVVDLTGIEPASPRGQLLVTACLLARRAGAHDNA